MLSFLYNFNYNHHIYDLNNKKTHYNVFFYYYMKCYLFYIFLIVYTVYSNIKIKKHNIMCFFIFIYIINRYSFKNEFCIFL